MPPAGNPRAAVANVACKPGSRSTPDAPRRCPAVAEHARLPEGHGGDEEFLHTYVRRPLLLSLIASDAGWVANEIDAFILDKQEETCSKFERPVPGRETPWRQSTFGTSSVAGCFHAQCLRWKTGQCSPDDADHRPRRAKAPQRSTSSRREMWSAANELLILLRDLVRYSTLAGEEPIVDVARLYGEGPDVSGACKGPDRI